MDWTFYINLIEHSEEEIIFILNIDLDLIKLILLNTEKLEKTGKEIMF